MRKAKYFERLFRELQLDKLAYQSPLTREEKLEQRRSELKNGLTDIQRLFLFGKLSGLNDKDAAIAAGYSLSVAENTKQRIWKKQVRIEFERLQLELAERVQDGPQNRIKATHRRPAGGVWRQQGIAYSNRCTATSRPPVI